MAVSDQVQDLYRTAADVRASFGDDRSSALAYYSPLLDFVTGLRPPDSAPGATRLLDVGCGMGWSTFAFADRGYTATGIDMNAEAFEAPPRDGCAFGVGSATEIPFEAGTFDLVVCYQCLEHVPAPRRALAEMGRVCRSGGVIAIVGPNLLSPTVGLLNALKPSCWRRLTGRRRPGMPRHPYGNTIGEILGVAVVRACQLTAKLLSRVPSFTMRDPDLVTPFFADNDACYLCNPTDLVAYFRQHGYRLERRGRPGRPPLAYLFAGGTWVAARKPAQTVSSRASLHIESTPEKQGSVDAPA